MPRYAFYLIAVVVCLYAIYSSVKAIVFRETDGLVIGTLFFIGTLIFFLARIVVRFINYVQTKTSKN